MKKAIILHGKPKKERYENSELPKPHEANWLPWIQSKLGERGVTVAIPALPKPYYPVYEEWKREFESYEVDSETALIGFSAGADFVLRWLSENKDITPEVTALVAPWQDNAGKYGDFSRYALDANLGKRIGKIAIFNSLDDSAPIQANVRRLKKAIPEAKLIQLKGYGHFMLGNNMTTQEFPELLEELSESIR
jgi:predicted alpha/beta hydrolase family esterase